MNTGKKTLAQLQPRGMQIGMGQRLMRPPTQVPGMPPRKAASAPPIRHPAPTPPAHRPQPISLVLQRKINSNHQPPAHQLRQPVAPPVYRPQPTPLVLQRKSASRLTASHRQDPAIVKSAQIAGRNATQRRQPEALIQLATALGRSAAQRLGSAVERRMDQRTASTIQAAYLYRGMQASAPNGNTPLLGNDNGYQLGVRAGEYEVDILGMVKLDSGGMSTSNTAAAVPDFTVSRSYQGGSHNTTAQNTQAFRWKWRFDDANLPAKLKTRNDHGNHVVIEPREEMLPGDFADLVQSTQAHWVRLAPP